MQVQAWVKSYSSNCSAAFVQTEEADVTPTEGASPYVELRAAQDISPGDLIFSKRTVSSVTTSVPEWIETNRRAGNFDYFFCNSCASFLAVPLECPNEFQIPQSPVGSAVPPVTPTSPSPATSFQDPNNPTQGSLDPGTSISAHPDQLPKPPGAPSPPSQPPSNRDFMFCSPDHFVPTCSAACRESSKDFDLGLCGSNLEFSLRQGHLNGMPARSIADCKTQCLRDLLFLRYIVMGINLDENPLRTNNLMFATSGPNMRGADDGEDLEPWSFVSHVIQPVRYLYTLFDDSNLDQFLYLKHVDGWIINALLAKISRAMSVSRGPRYAKGFGADGMLGRAIGRGDPGWEGFASKTREEEEGRVWVASVDSLVNLIRVADEGRGERANVVVRRGVGVRVSAGVKVGRGEVLLREKEVEGGFDWGDGGGEG